MFKKSADDCKWYPVEVTLDNDCFHDAIKGIDEENALKNAYWNWPDAKLIKLIEEE